jgi:ribonuclease P protein component
MIHHNSFSKAEHLCGEKRISRLFTEGEAFICYPLRVVYIIDTKSDEVNVSAMVSVPKKRFKQAVKRNQIKRMMREAYRQNKQILVQNLDEKGLQMHVAFNYVADEKLNFDAFEKKMKLSLQKLQAKIEPI